MMGNAHDIARPGSSRSDSAAADASLFGPLAYDRKHAPHTSAQEREPDLVCFSNSRWEFVYRAHQQLSRHAQKRRVFFFEEPVTDSGSMRLDVSRRDCGVWVVVPRVPEGLTSEVALEAVVREMIDQLFGERGIRDYVLWHDTPSARRYARHLKPLSVVHDWQDALPAKADGAASA